jgi:hypothetical protein
MFLLTNWAFQSCILAILMVAMHSLISQSSADPISKARPFYSASTADKAHLLMMQRGNWGYKQPQRFRPPGPAADRFGAIAISQSVGVFAWSFERETPEDAIKRALTRCQSDSNAQDCEPLIAYPKGCGAVYAGEGGLTANSGSTIVEAVNQARLSCIQHSTDCRPLFHVCTDMRWRAFKASPSTNLFSLERMLGDRKQDGSAPPGNSRVSIRVDMAGYYKWVSDGTPRRAMCTLRILGGPLMVIPNGASSERDCRARASWCRTFTAEEWRGASSKFGAGSPITVKPPYYICDIPTEALPFWVHSAFRN